jgi:hypothetical protein
MFYTWDEQRLTLPFRPQLDDPGAMPELTDEVLMETQRDRDDARIEHALDDARQALVTWHCCAMLNLDSDTLDIVGENLHNALADLGACGLAHAVVMLMFDETQAEAKQRHASANGTKKVATAMMRQITEEVGRD